MTELPVVGTSEGFAAISLQDGWTALSSGRWREARRAFVAALEREQTPEALEGLSWAAWWLDDANTVFEARERAFRLYRKRGQLANAARMAVWLGADHLDFHGAAAVASGWLHRARRLLDPLEPGPDHGWLAFHEGYRASAAGDTSRSLELAERAAQLGRDFQVPDLEMLGLALQGAVRVACAEVEAGMACLDEATVTALAGEAEIPISSAWACCFLITACEAIRDYPRAFEWCDRIAEFAVRYGSRYMLGFCRAHYGTVHMWQGGWAEAEAELNAAVEAYSRSRPSFVPGALAALAELRRRQGRWEEADRLLERAGGGAGLLCRAQLALDRGDARTAVALAERALRRVPERCRIERAPAFEILARASVRRGELDRAAEALAQLREVARLGGTLPLSAAADLAEGMIAAARGDHERARPLLEDAVDGFERSGAPFEAAEAHIELAATLVALGQADAAEHELRTSLDRFTELGADAGARRVRSLLHASPTDSTPLAELTRREREVLGLVAEGLTNRQIAGRLVVSEHTVHRHVTNLLRKLDLPSRTAAATYAVRSGLSRSDE